MNPFITQFRFARLAVALGCLAIGTTQAVAQDQPVTEGPLPSVDTALAQAIENSPDVAAAKAKLALAEAELSSKRLDVSRQVLNDYSSLNNLGTQSDVLKAKLQMATAMLDIEKQRLNAGTSAEAQSEVIRRQAEIQEIKAQLAQVASQTDATGRQLRMLLGSKPPSDSRSPSSGTSAGATRPQQIPQGPVVDRIIRILDQMIDLQFSDPQPLKDVLEYISAKHKLPIYVHPSLDASSILINLTLKDVPVRYAFESIQELAHEDVCFVVRDYGILVVTTDIAEQNGYVSAVDFAR